jgi:vancomycin resistance protein YoaR
VTTPRGQLTISEAAIAKSLVLTADARGEIKPRVDGTRLRAAIAGQLAKVETQPREARITTAGGTPEILASTGGQLVDTGKLSTDLLAVLRQPADRTVAADLVAVAPRTTAEDLAVLGIKEQVSTFTTHFTGGLSSPRTKNIIQIAREVDGAIVRPGETFSLNGHTGPRGYAEGYRDAPIILDGKLVPGVGGGASQFTTTIFNAAYYAGLKDVEHKPHSYYFSRYPAVIESTIYYPDLDLKFRNDTRYGVLIDTSYTADSITVSMWSTKVYDSVRTVYSARRDVTQPEKIYLDPGPTCIATSGSEGFTQDAWRIFRKDGREIKREKFTWRYDAEPEYVCGQKPQS